MTSLLKSPRAWAIFAVVSLLLGAAWHMTAYPRGMLMARLDHAREHYEVKTYGGPPLSPLDAERAAEYARLLRERYDVELNPVIAFSQQACVLRSPLCVQW